MGPVRVTIVGQQRTQSVTVALPAAEIPRQLDIAVQNKTLTIDAHPLQYQATPILIVIRLQQPLNSLLASGSADITCTSCGNPNLSIIVKDTANVHFLGKNAVYAVQNDGNNAVVIEDIDGKKLIVGGSRQGRIILSGQVDQLTARLTGPVLLDAQRLQARSAHISTRDKAAAYVWVSEVLYGFARDNSDIYYRARPERVVADTYASGNVLKLSHQY
jgi:hypothetical protein